MHTKWIYTKQEKRKNMKTKSHNNMMLVDSCEINC